MLVLSKYTLRQTLKMLKGNYFICIGAERSTETSNDFCKMFSFHLILLKLNYGFSEETDEFQAK